MKAPVRPEWREIFQEWSTRFWMLALAIAGINEKYPNLVDELAIGLSPEAVTRISLILGAIGFLAKFAPQPELQKKAEARRNAHVED